MGFSNTSLEYLNYPTQVIFKCCKLIPVLIGGILIQRKQYGVLDFLAAGSMCCGLSLFTLADSYMSPNFDSVGVFVISLALLCDAAIGNVQEKSMKNYNATNTEVVFYSYSIGFVYLFVIMVLTGKLFSGFSFCLQVNILNLILKLRAKLGKFVGLLCFIIFQLTCLPDALGTGWVTTHNESKQKL